MKTRALLFASLLLGSSGGVLPAAGEPAATSQWESPWVTFTFDTQKGTYSLSDKRDGSRIIEDAAFHINGFASNHGAYEFSFEQEPTSDELGTGRKVTIIGKVLSTVPQPSLILEVVLYDNRGAVSLNLGVDNLMDREYRVKAFSPLKGISYKGHRFEDYWVLDGESGADNTQVTSLEKLESRNNALVTFGRKGARKHSLVAGGLTYHEFQKYVTVKKEQDSLHLELRADDPVGKLIDPKSRYLFHDKFYVDFTIDNRFEALEAYGQALRLATRSDVSGVTIPILNFWYAFIPKFGGDDFRNNSVGTVEQMEVIGRTGFLKYSPVGIRLEPDSYSKPNNQQGWWDDQHWQMYKGGQLLPPYETIVKWGTKIRELGGVPFIYSQTGRRSEDYVLAFPEHTLFNDPTALRSKGRIGWWGRAGDATAAYWTYDYTDLGFIAHLRNVYQNQRNGLVQGIKFDYPDTGWAYDGGFEDKYSTTTSAYRNIYRMAYEGLGPGRDVQERIPPFGDVALGLITTQRTEGDNDRVYPMRVAKTGLRWYKNRMVANYDHDPINPHHVYPTDTREGWRSAITLTYTTSGRMEIGKYFDKMTPEMIFDLSRAVPLLDAPTVSARPVDAFSGKLYPEVYDFRAGPGWHILTLNNWHIEGEVWPTDVMAYWEQDKQFIPKKMIPATISVALSDATDEGGLGLDAARAYYVFDFWNWAFVGKLPGSTILSQNLRPGEARILALHEARNVPQFISTNRHLLQGYLDLPKRPTWNEATRELTGAANVVAQEEFKIAIATNGHRIRSVTAPQATARVDPLDEAASIYVITLLSASTAPLDWTLAFEPAR